MSLSSKRFASNWDNIFYLQNDCYRHDNQPTVFLYSTGTQFQLEKDVGTKCFGYIPLVYFNVTKPQVVERHFSTCCGDMYLRNIRNGNPTGNLTLRLLD